MIDRETGQAKRMSVGVALAVAAFSVVLCAFGLVILLARQVAALDALFTAVHSFGCPSEGHSFFVVSDEETDSDDSLGGHERDAVSCPVILPHACLSFPQVASMGCGSLATFRLDAIIAPLRC